MRIRRVEGNPIIASCIECGRRVDMAKGLLFADLDGEPFRAYYCATDAAKRDAAEVEKHFAPEVQP